MSALSSLKNIGKEMEHKLTSIGIATAEELINLGSKEAFIKLKTAYPNICLVHLYTLEGAISNIEYNQLNEDTKQQLRKINNSLKNNGL